MPFWRYHFFLVPTFVVRRKNGTCNTITGSVAEILHHNSRTENYSNRDIDASRSKYNYSLSEHENDFSYYTQRLSSTLHEACKCLYAFQLGRDASFWRSSRTTQIVFCWNCKFFKISLRSRELRKCWCTLRWNNSASTFHFYSCSFWRKKNKGKKSLAKSFLRLKSFTPFMKISKSTCKKSLEKT